MNRYDTIRETFVLHFMEIGAVSLELSAKDWPGDRASNLRAPLGFTAPEPQGHDWVATFSAELIEDLTSELDDEDFEDALQAMLFCMDYEVALHDRGLSGDPAARVETTDNHLATEAPGSLRLLTEIHMRWLDRQVC